ncbi:hypothetical protein FSPOR_7308 [Fusarium sporotrichioides]|uniref:Uncharacterized protein n=1 Tax=Fusarium sporotrichioides TaxID=5514 RepID=A0A395RZ02_FUSSP|nr:hypothetical protein FSPOR_7308 [Fusarium sporotrichioides]
MSSSPETKDFGSKAKEAEYQALWQTCDRTTRKVDYIYAGEETKREILHTACRARLEKRRTQGKTMCATNLASMVDLHIQREAARLRYHAPRAMQALDPVPNPGPNLFPFPAQPQHYNANPVASNPVQNPYSGVPQRQQMPQVPMAPPGFDMPMHSENHVVRSVHDRLNTLEEYTQRLVNTLRDYHGRVVALEARIQQGSQERRAAASAQHAHPIHDVMQYPMEGLNGGVFNCAMRPATPASQTLDGDGDEDVQEVGVPLVEG